MERCAAEVVRASAAPFFTPLKIYANYANGEEDTVKRRYYVHHDIFVGIVLILFSLTFFLLSRDFPGLSALVPQSFICLLILLALIMMAYALKETRRGNARIREGKPFEPEITLGTVKRPMQGFLFILVYSLCVHYIGFFVSTALFMVAFMAFLRVKSWLQIILSTILMEAFVYALFVMQLKLVLPKGLLF